MHMKFDPDQPFDLPILPPAMNFRHEEFFDILMKTRTELGELNGYSYTLPNPILLLSPTGTEGVSCKLEYREYQHHDGRGFTGSTFPRCRAEEA